MPPLCWPECGRRGHGIQAKGRNYLIPADAQLQTEADVEFEALDLGRVLGKMEDARCQLNIVVLDACRDNPFARSFRSATQGLALVDAPRGTLLAFATSPGAVAADGTDGNGLYTKHLLANMERPDLSIEEVFKQVRIGVVGETSGRQTPWETSSLMGSFYFQPENGSAALPARPSSSPSASSAATPVAPPAPLAPPATPDPPVSTAALPPPAKSAGKTPALDTEIRKCLHLLQSGKAQDQRYAAKKIIRAYPTERILLDAVDRELLKGYQLKSRDKYHADAMAWFCNVLGARLRRKSLRRDPASRRRDRSGSQVEEIRRQESAPAALKSGRRQKGGLYSVLKKREGNMFSLSRWLRGWLVGLMLVSLAGVCRADGFVVRPAAPGGRVLDRAAPAAPERADGESEGRRWLLAVPRATDRAQHPSEKFSYNWPRAKEDTVRFGRVKDGLVPSPPAAFKPDAGGWRPLLNER